MLYKSLKVVGALFGTFVLLSALLGMPTQSATTLLPGTKSTLDAQLKPCFWCSRSNEYGRRVVLLSPSKRDITLELEFDTGGYNRAELYELPHRQFLFKGHHELLEINAQAHSIREISRTPEVVAYLGAFDYDRKAQQWRFFQASESAAQFHW